MRTLVVVLAAAASACTFAFQVGPGRDEIGQVHPGATTRAQVRRLLEPPGGVDLDRFASWDLGESTVVVTTEEDGSGEVSGETGATFRVVARFEGDLVEAVDVAAELSLAPTDAMTPPERLTAASEILAAAGGPGSSVFALDEHGVLLSGPGAGGRLEPLLELPGPFPPGAFFSRSGAAVAVSPDGRLVAATLRGVLRVVDVERRAVLALLEGAPASDEGWDLAFSPDGRRLAAAGARGLVVYLVDGWETAWRRDGGPIVKVAFSPDGTRLVAVGTELLVLEAATGTALGRVARRPEGWSGYAVRVLDDEVIAAGPQTLERWSLPGLEAAWRDGGRAAATRGGGADPALLDVRALPAIAPGTSLSRGRFLSPDGAFLVEAAQLLWVLRISDLAPVVVAFSPHANVARFDPSLGQDGWLLLPEGRRLLRWNLTAWR